MREYLFRGKRVDNGKWVEGSYVRIDYHDSNDYVERDLIILPNGHELEVIPESVGMWTGLEDKEDVKVFEGDLIKHINFGEDYGEVKFTEGAFWIESVVASTYHSSVIKVVGSIHDNKELLK